MRQFTPYPGCVAVFNTLTEVERFLTQRKRQTGRVRFRATTDGWLATSFHVDDVSLQ